MASIASSEFSNRKNGDPSSAQPKVRMLHVSRSLRKVGASGLIISL
jgi:hypothetical protein